MGCEPMAGYALKWGIWNCNHDITSRDIGTAEVHKTMGEVNASIKDKQINYQKMGYELWFTDIDATSIRVCACGKYASFGGRCWWCGK